MAQGREGLGKPLVSLEAGRLLGMRQVTRVLSRSAAGASGDADGSAGKAVEPRVEMSRLLSKIGAPET